MQAMSLIYTRHSLVLSFEQGAKARKILLVTLRLRISVRNHLSYSLWVEDK